MTRPEDLDPLNRTDPATTADLRRVGATYRQIDHWTARGYLDPADGERSPGSGCHRQWTQRDVRLVALMLRLIESGMVVSAAAKIAADAVDRGRTSVTTGAGLVLTIEPDEPTPAEVTEVVA